MRIQWTTVYKVAHIPQPVTRVYCKSNQYFGNQQLFHKCKKRLHDAHYLGVCKAYLMNDSVQSCANASTCHASVLRSELLWFVITTSFTSIGKSYTMFIKSAFAQQTEWTTVYRIALMPRESTLDETKQESTENRTYIVITSAAVSKV